MGDEVGGGRNATTSSEILIRRVGGPLHAAVAHVDNENMNEDETNQTAQSYMHLRTDKKQQNE